jgi:nicotinate-nucleotide adenylyltransferase
VLPRVGREVVRLARAELEGRGEPMGVPLLDRETEQTAVRDGETWSTPARPDGDAPDVLLFGGTFDPPHRGHFELAVRARELALGEDAWLVFVPAARNPHKTGGPIASDADRLDMLRAMCDGRERTAIWTEELDRAARTGEPSYWVNTLERTRQMLGDRRRIRFLIGADQAVAFDRWREPERILQLAMPLVLPRAPYTSADRLIEALHASGRPDAERWRAWFAPEATPLADCSSSRVRELIANGASDRELHGVVDGRVLEIIRERRLYGASTSGPGPLSRDHPRA